MNSCVATQPSDGGSCSVAANVAEKTAREFSHGLDFTKVTKVSANLGLNFGIGPKPK